MRIIIFFTLLAVSVFGQTEYWIVKGDLNDGGSRCDESTGGCEARLEAKTELRRVRCCADSEPTSSSASWTLPNHDSCPWITSNTASCSGTLNWDDANAFCTNIGGRLCTKDELLNSCVGDSGCSYDYYMLWSSTPYSQPAGCRDTQMENSWDCLNEISGYANYECAYWSNLYCTHSNAVWQTAAHACCASSCDTCSEQLEPPSAESTHYVLKGDLDDDNTCDDSTNGCATALIPDSSIRSVKCCSDVEISGWSKKSFCSVWASTGDTCSQLNYNDAHDYCAAQGGRLCTKAELEDSCAGETGCQYDHYQVWTSTDAPLCTELSGKEGAGTDNTKTQGANQVSLTQCSLHVALNYPDANGVSYNPTTQECFAEFSMTETVSNSDKKACYLDYQEECICGQSWTTSATGCTTTQTGCPTTACNSDVTGSWCVVTDKTCRDVAMNGNTALDYFYCDTSTPVHQTCRDTQNENGWDCISEYSGGWAGYTCSNWNYCTSNNAQYKTAAENCCALTCNTCDSMVEPTITIPTGCRDTQNENSWDCISDFSGGWSGYDCAYWDTYCTNSNALYQDAARKCCASSCSTCDDMLTEAEYDAQNALPAGCRDTQSENDWDCISDNSGGWSGYTCEYWDTYCTNSNALYQDSARKCCAASCGTCDDMLTQAEYNAQQASSDSYTLLHSGGECGSGDTDLGSKSTVQECAEAVLGSGGTWFIYGTGAKAGNCFKESTTSDSCPEGFETDEYDFYRANAATPTGCRDTQGENSWDCISDNSGGWAGYDCEYWDTYCTNSNALYQESARKCCAASCDTCDDMLTQAEYNAQQANPTGCRDTQNENDWDCISVFSNGWSGYECSWWDTYCTSDTPEYQDAARKCCASSCNTCDDMITPAAYEESQANPTGCRDTQGENSWDCIYDYSDGWSAYDCAYWDVYCDSTVELYQQAARYCCASSCNTCDDMKTQDDYMASYNAGKNDSSSSNAAVIIIVVVLVLCLCFCLIAGAFIFMTMQEQAKGTPGADDAGGKGDMENAVE